jgi:hypothetical protein
VRAPSFQKTEILEYLFLVQGQGGHKINQKILQTCGVGCELGRQREKILETGLMEEEQCVMEEEQGVMEEEQDEQEEQQDEMEEQVVKVEDPTS